MSNLPDRPWTEEEKYFLLAEILKKHSVPHSYLVRIVHEFRIAPNWGDIPLPQGRSLNSCRIAFDNMLAQTPSQQPAMPSPSVQMPRPDTRTPGPVDPNVRKRTLYPADNKPRAIQPRPPPSVASYSSESGASTQLSPRLEGPGEPPRKRGRPSKAETERRRAAAEARGETYPPPRRPGSARMKITPSPTSPPGPPPPGPPLQPYTYPQHQVHGPNPSSMPFDPVMGAGRHIAPAPSLPHGHEERRDIAARGMGPNPRELPRPQEMTLPIPSHAPALQLGPPSSFPPRLNNEPVERSPFGPVPPDRFSPDSGRRDSVTSRGEPPPPHGPYSEGRASITPGEKPR